MEIIIFYFKNFFSSFTIWFVNAFLWPKNNGNIQIRETHNYEDRFLFVKYLFLSKKKIEPKALFFVIHRNIFV